MTPLTPRFVCNVIVKAAVLFLAANLAFAAAYPLPQLGRISAYNRLFPGRVRLPYGDRPDRAYNLSLYNLEAMFAAHEISAGPKPPAKIRPEYRVILIGDSATWGFLLPPEETLAAHLNGLQLQAPDGRPMRFYNLGYPVMSLTKDLLILSRALAYQPDLIVWLATLESFPYDKQLYPPLLQNNPGPVRALIQTYGLRLDPNDPAFQSPGFAGRTLVGARRPLADLLRLQLYGPLWAATGVDQDLPANYTPWARDLEPDLGFHNLQPPHLAESDLAFDVLAAGRTLAGPTPLLLVNEPMAISQGQNSSLRYNFFYPRWAYDDYRQIIARWATAHGWAYLDAWDAIAPGEFTNSAVHLSPQGSRQFAGLLAPAILAAAGR